MAYLLALRPAVVVKVAALPGFPSKSGFGNIHNHPIKQRYDRHIGIKKEHLDET